MSDNTSIVIIILIIVGYCLIDSVIEQNSKNCDNEKQQSIMVKDK